MKYIHLPSFSNTLVWLFGVFLLACSLNAHATAPRITAQLFGEERKADIVAYQFSPFNAQTKAEITLAVELMTEAYKAAKLFPELDILPSKQLALYALSNNEAVALLGSPKDITKKARSQYHISIFFFRGDQPVSMIFNKAHGLELQKGFIQGLQTIIKNGEYQKILEKHHIESPANFVERLKQKNPDLK